VLLREMRSERLGSPQIRVEQDRTELFAAVAREAISCAAQRPRAKRSNAA